MGNIKVLSDQVANQIAAGEVVERPMSVIKELMENALDAQANRIDVYFENGGLDRIEVRDNGTGMDAEDAHTAFLRHATSKISKGDDLHHISTLGFRGEALPSIAAVSKVTLDTRQREELGGVRINISGGRIESEAVVGCPVGTSIVVTDLFFNTPARKKFMKSSRAEAMRILDIFKKIALSHPQVSFQLYKDKDLIITTSGNGRLIDVIGEIFGVEDHEGFCQVQHAKGNVEIRGYVGKPALSHNNRQKQYLFVNNRFVSDISIQHALEKAFTGQLPSKRFPVAVLFLTIPLSLVDVNVHPAKSEVRFAEPRAIYSVVVQGVVDALSQLQYQTQQEMQQPQRTQNSEPRQFAKPIKFANNTNYERENGRHRYQVISETPTSLSNRPSFFKPESKDTPLLDQIMVLGQIHNSYILIQTRTGLAIIDQHAAHERVIYQKLSQRQSEKNEDIQHLIVPLTIKLPRWQSKIMGTSLKKLHQLGIIIEAFGNDTYVIRGVPNFMARKLSKDILHEIINEVTMSLRQQSVQNIREAMLIQLACHGAINAKEALNKTEIVDLIGSLISCHNWLTCPHGRPTIWQISLDELDKKFLRK